jgi:transketolase
MKDVKDKNLALQLEKKAYELRKMMVEMLRDAETSGHYGGAMSVMDILTVLYHSEMKVDPANPKWEDRDRLILGKGHTSCALCPVLADLGFFPKKLLATFNKLDSPFSMHPDMNKIAGCDMSTGSLGHGLPVGVGMALAAQYLGKKSRIYVVLGDSEMGEGSVWEAIQEASHFELDNLCATIDRNGFSCDGPTEGTGKAFADWGGILGTLRLEPIDKKLAAFGWHVIEADGHSAAQLLEAYKEARSVKGKPSAIIAHTVKGKGISFIENRAEWHIGEFNEEQTRRSLDDLTKKIDDLTTKLKVSLPRVAGNRRTK